MILAIDHTKKGMFRNLSRTGRLLLDPSTKNNTASILKSTRVRTCNALNHLIRNVCVFPVTFKNDCLMILCPTDYDSGFPIQVREFKSDKIRFWKDFLLLFSYSRFELRAAQVSLCK